MATIPTAAVIAFKNNNNKVLLVKHGAKASHLNDTYGLPGGTLENNETDIQCAFREFIEETGLQTSMDYLVEFPGNFYSAEIEKKDGSRHTYPWRVFLCTKFSGELKSSEETMPIWIDINKLGSLNLLPNVKNVILAGLNFINRQND